VVAALCLLALGAPDALAADGGGFEALELPKGDSTYSAPSRKPLQGRTEVTEMILQEQPLYKQAMQNIAMQNFGQALVALQKLTQQLGDGYEGYRAECDYFQGVCLENLRKQSAAADMYKRAFELFAKFDESNPLKAKAEAKVNSMKATAPLTGQLAKRAPDLPNMQGQRGAMDRGVPMDGGISLADLVGSIENSHFLRNPVKSQIAIDPQAQLAVRDSSRDIPLLEVNDRRLIPLIVTKCFQEMNCLETFEIGSNTLTAATDWMPISVDGRAAAFGLDGHANPAFKATVNGRQYTFDVVLPDFGSGLRKILLITNKEKICAVDVESFDTWLLRLEPAKDGSITSARWYKLTHVKPGPNYQNNIAKPQVRHPATMRNW
jgi:hypothetical protein